MARLKVLQPFAKAVVDCFQSRLADYVLTCVEGKAENTNPYAQSIPDFREHCLLIHESYAADSEMLLDDATWHVFSIDGKSAAAVLDFNCFFTSEKSSKSSHDWLFSASVAGEMDRIRSLMPELAAELEQLTNQSDPLPSVMLELVSSKQH